jgi:hypothetical protein
MRAFGGFFSGYPTIERHQGVITGKIIYFDFGESSFRVNLLAGKRRWK